MLTTHNGGSQTERQLPCALRVLDFALRAGVTVNADADSLTLKLPLALPSAVRRRIGSGLADHAHELARLYGDLAHARRRRTLADKRKGPARGRALETISTKPVRGKDRAST
jgi:hypothetical protein